MSSVASAQSWPNDSPHPQTKAAGPSIEWETVECLMCGGGDSEPVVFAADPTTHLGGTFRVVRCCDCGLTFTNPRPTQASIGIFYPDDYKPHVGRAWDSGWQSRVRRQLERSVLRAQFGYPLQPVDRLTAMVSVVARIRINRSRQRQWWIPFRQPGRLLDFGCGAGDFLRRMREFGWSVEGMDISADVAGDVKNRTGIPVHVGTLPHSDIQPGAYDAVTMWNSLEHVHEPRHVVQAAQTALRPGGILVIGVPNVASWSFEKFQQDWHGLELPRHLTHFAPSTLRNLVEAEGFRFLSIQQIARGGWFRKSVRNATASGLAPWWLRACRWKPIGQAVADWTERVGRADFIRLIAEKK